MAIAGGYVVAQASKITILSGKTGQLSIRGLQGMALPIGAVASTTDISVIGTRISTKVATGLSYSNISTKFYFAKGDVSQIQLMKYQREGTQVQDMRFWIDATDFAALDLINDPGGYMMIGTFSSPTANKNEVFTGDCEIVPAGSNIFFDRHISGTTLSFTAGGEGVSAQVADSGNGFVTAGFAVGDTVIIDYLGAANPLWAKVKTVVAGTMTFEDGIGDEASITTTAGVAATAIHGATPVEVEQTF